MDQIELNFQCYSPQCQPPTTTAAPLPPPPPVPAAPPPNNPPAPTFDQDAGGSSVISGTGTVNGNGDTKTAVASPQLQQQPQAVIQPSYQETVGGGGTWGQASFANGNSGATAAVSNGAGASTGTGGNWGGAGNAAVESGGLQPSGYGGRRRIVASGQPVRKVCFHVSPSFWPSQKI